MNGKAHNVYDIVMRTNTRRVLENSYNWIKTIFEQFSGEGQCHEPFFLI